MCIRSITAILSLELRRKQLLLLHASRSLIRGYDLTLGMMRHQSLFLLLLFFWRHITTPNLVRGGRLIAVLNQHDVLR